LALGWVTVFGRAYHLGMLPPTRPTQPHAVSSTVCYFCFFCYVLGRIAKKKCGLLLQMSHAVWSVCLSVCLLVTLMYCAKTVEPIAMPFAGADSCGPKAPRSRYGLKSPTKKGNSGGLIIESLCCSVYRKRSFRRQ